MRDLIMLTHRLPYPPDKGDKIRSFHWLAGLSVHYRVHLGTFIDDVADRRHILEVSRYCSSIKVVQLGRQATLRAGLSALVRREPISVSMYRNTKLGRWVDALCDRYDIIAALAFSSGVGPYLQRPGLQHARRVLDFVDVDSDKWRQYAARSAWPRSWLYDREARLLARAEASLANWLDAGVLVSVDEAALFASRISPGHQIEVIANGVDGVYFDPAQVFDNPYSDERVVVFTGAMDYSANVDAVTWFARHVWPRLKSMVPDLVFYIVGSNPTRAVRRLTAATGIRVTGRVPDIRPFIAHASVAVAPLRIARGIQNKVLEALAMDRPIVATPQAVEGLPEIACCLDSITEDATVMARIISRLLAGDSRIEVGMRRARVLANYGWTPAVDRLRALLDGQPGQGGI